jgi:hypothetical protein
MLLRVAVIIIILVRVVVDMVIKLCCLFGKLPLLYSIAMCLSKTPPRAPTPLLANYPDLMNLAISHLSP